MVHLRRLAQTRTKSLQPRSPSPQGTDLRVPPRIGGKSTLRERKWVRVAAAKTLKKVALKKQFSSLDIGFLSSAEMRKLNARYRQKDYATDVLSFPPPPAASLAICLQVTKRQAKEHGVTYKEELQRMTIHGVLHLLGYDHEKSSRAERTMTALQESILESLQ